MKQLIQKCKKADYFVKYDQCYPNDCKKYDDPECPNPSLQGENDCFN